MHNLRVRKTHKIKSDGEDREDYTTCLFKNRDPQKDGQTGSPGVCRRSESLLIISPVLQTESFL